MRSPPRISRVSLFRPKLHTRPDWQPGWRRATDFRCLLPQFPSCPPSVCLSNPNFGMTYLVFRLVYLEPGTASLVFVVCSYNSLHVASFVCQALNSVLVNGTVYLEFWMIYSFFRLYTVLPDFVFVFVHVIASAPQ